MERVEPACWCDDDHALWLRIAAHDFEIPDASLTFAARLARDHGWGLEAARVAIDEYRRFCFLAVRTGHEVTPSEEVDEVWHQHLTDSRDYWQVWCPDVLHHDLHHGPTRGGPAEGRRFAGQYADTLAAYEAWFGPPPAALWPGTAERFGRPRFHVVDRATHVAVLVPREPLARLRRLVRALRLGALLALASGRSAEAASLNPLDWTAGPFLALYAALACASLVAALKLPALLFRGGARPGGQSQLTPAQLGFLAGGAPRATDILILDDLAARRISLEHRVRRFGLLSSTSDILTVGGQDVKRSWLASEKADEVADLRRGLAEDGLILSEAHTQSSRRITLALVSPVILLGLVKMMVGLERDKPVGVLLFLLGATAVAASALTARPLISRAGRALVESYKDEHGRALRAPRPEEVVSAFAITGVAALAGTEFEAYGRLMKAEDGGGSGGGGGCGGGGCGGCGGS